MNENEVAAIVVDAALEVHKTLGGPGLLESVYEEALAYELDLKLALVINFGQRLLKNGIHRVVNGL